MKRGIITLKKITLPLMILFFVIAFFLHILALLNIFPIIISVPLLFLAILIPIVFINNRKRFKGF
ncbi:MULTISPECIES: hypothetical protein [Neobacillus]|jgi:hypothetical protein|uniref:Uncharacterized protein n=1 Tax=Neobacillus sedimentimangrovi TaxID=2699460 RepID=A0ABS8QER8_9BACI|nr:hypothetical protein [Neobacillus sedimentimangrovi]MCD4837739.1 hypothetical protein [Neobacillus sedimentimangrovi]